MMVRNVAKNLLAVAATACLAVVLTACGGGGGGDRGGGGTEGKPAEEVKSTGRPTSWSAACDGLFDAETVAEMRADRRDDVVYEVSRGGGTKAATAALAAKLGESTASPTPGGEVCRVENSEGTELVSVAYEWDAEPFPTDEAKAGKSVTYETDEPYLAQYVDCLRPDLAEPGERMAALRGRVVLGADLDVHSGGKVLQTVTTRMLPALRCTNKIVFPPLPEVDPDLV